MKIFSFFFVRQHAEEDNSNFLHLQSILPHLATQSINQSASSIHQSHPAGKPEEGRRSDPVYSAIKEETASPSQVGIFIVPGPHPLVGPMIKHNFVKI